MWRRCRHRPSRFARRRRGRRAIRWGDCRSRLARLTEPSGPGATSLCHNASSLASRLDAVGSVAFCADGASILIATRADSPAKGKGRVSIAEDSAGVAIETVDNFALRRGDAAREMAAVRARAAPGDAVTVAITLAARGLTAGSADAANG